jgi:FtsP/CotA-like multicopper oxidase with cupredoxin domain
MMKGASLSRRKLLGGFGLFGLATSTTALWAGQQATGQSPTARADGTHSQAHAGMAMKQSQMTNGNDMPPSHTMAANMVQGDVTKATNGFDPMEVLTDFDYGTVSKLPDGRTLREYRLFASDKTIEIAPNVAFPAWVYNNRVPGPTIRCTQGDRIKVIFVNGSSHPHSIHFHGMHMAAMDGVDPIEPGKQFTYEFDAEPFGLHLYHCHTVPIRRHIHKGLYGTFIIDPPKPRPSAKELVMVMNAFDTNFDGENEVYAVNTVAFHYAKHPIPLKVNELVRVYLVNVTEFDPVNSLHLHANLFNVYRTGTRLEPQEFTDMIMLAQAERHILEFRYKFPGKYMFHAHQSEFTELGWMGMFEVS